MNMKQLFLVLSLLLISININAGQIIIKNKSSSILKILPVPHGILSMPHKDRVLLLQENIAFIKPHTSVTLKFDQLESIEIKVLNRVNNIESWYKYDQEKTPILFDLIKATESSKQNVKLVILGSGNIYQIKSEGELRLAPPYLPENHIKPCAKKLARE